MELSWLKMDRRKVWFGLAWLGFGRAGWDGFFYFGFVFKPGSYWAILSIFATVALDFESIIKESVFAFLK